MNQNNERKIYADNSLIIVIVSSVIFIYMTYIENVDIGLFNIILASTSGIITGVAIILRLFNGNKPYILFLYLSSLITIYTIYQANILHSTNGIILVMSCAVFGWYLPQLVMRKKIINKVQL